MLVQIIGSDTSVMVYKSFLIDHHFCILGAFSPLFEQFHRKSLDRVTENLLPGLFLCPKKRNFTLEVCRTISTVQQDLNIKTELKNLIYSIFGAYPIAKYWAKVNYICRLG